MAGVGVNGPSELVALVDQRIRAAAVATRAFGTCAGRDVVGPGASVLFDGSTVAVPVKVLGHVVLRAGMRCTLDKYGTEWIVTGAFAVPEFGYTNMFVPGVVTTTTSAAFTDVAGFPTFQFVKYHDATAVEFTQSAVCYSQTATSRMRYALRLTQTDGDTPYTPVDIVGVEIRLDDINIRSPQTQQWIVPGPTNTMGSDVNIPAGVYTGVWRWRRTNGTGTLTMDTTDQFSLTVREKVLPSSPYV